MNGISSTILIFLVLTANALWFWLKYDLKNKGYSTSLFFNHFQDLSNAVTVIKNSNDSHIKQKYKVVLFSIGGVIILMPIIFFSNIESTKDWRCEKFHNYLNYEITAKIESKYIDKPNHAMKTLNLTDGRQESNATIFIKGLYDFLQPNDSIHKKAGNLEFLVYRNGETKTFIVDKSESCMD